MSVAQSQICTAEFCIDLIGSMLMSVLRMSSTMFSIGWVRRATGYKSKSTMMRSRNVRLRICWPIDCRRSSMRLVTVART